MTGFWSCLWTYVEPLKEQAKKECKSLKSFLPVEVVAYILYSTKMERFNKSKSLFSSFFDCDNRVTSNSK